MKLKQSSVYRRYLKYYSVMFILPVALLCMVIGLMINRMYVRALFDNHQLTVTRIGLAIDNALAGIDVMSAQLERASFLQPAWLKRSPLNVMEAQQRLKDLQSSNPLLADIVYHIRDDFVVSCNSGSTSARWSQPLLDSARAFSVRYGVPRRAQNPGAELFFVPDKQALQTYATTEIALETEAFQIWRGDALLYGTGRAVDDGYSFISDSAMGEWQYRYLTPKAPILVRQRMVYLLLLGGLLATFMLGLVLVLRFARLTYSPVEKIDSYVRTLYPEDGRYGRDEFDWMYQALSRLHESGSVLRERAELTEDAYHTLQLMSLIRGEIQSEAEVRQLQQAMGIAAEGSLLSLALAREAEGSPLHGLPESLAKSGVDARIIPLPEMGHVALLIAEREAGEAAQLLDSISRTFQLRVGVGNSYGHLIDASRSYMEAQAAFPHASGHRPVVHYRELEQTRGSYHYPYREINRVTSALQSLDTAQIQAAMDALRTALRKQVFPISMVRCICYDVISSVIKLSIDLTNQQHFPTVTELTNIPSVEHLVDLMIQCVDDFVATLQRDKRKNDYIFAQILEHMDRHVYDAGFSLGNMATELGFSQSYLSHLYKAKTGGNLIQLVSDKRIARAKALLRDTELPLREIIEQIGYNDTSNFIRKFKQDTGMTPGEYKAEARKHE